MGPRALLVAWEGLRLRRRLTGSAGGHQHANDLWNVAWAQLALAMRHFS